MTRSPTLIVFTREPVAGETKTRLIPHLGAKNAATLAHAFTLDALTKAQSLRLPIVIAGSVHGDARRANYFRALARRFDARLVDQGGGNLGARMARALAPLCDAGAVLIGTDTPSLPSRLLAQNVALLRRTRVVLGPSLDGGYYLVGVRGPLPDIFRGIRWGGAQVLAETIGRLKRIRIPHALGPSWYDVDRWSDLMLLAAHLSLRADSGRVSRKPIPRSANPPRDPHPCPATAHLLARLGLLSS
jgi:rSAM/selenodomain-associated transferase 1